MKKGDVEISKLLNFLLGVMAVIIIVILVFMWFNSGKEKTEPIIEATEDPIDQLKNFFGGFATDDEKELEFIRRDPSGYLGELIVEGDAFLAEGSRAPARNFFQHFIDVCGSIKDGVLQDDSLSLEEYNDKYRAGGKKLTQGDYDGLKEKCSDFNNEDKVGITKKIDEIDRTEQETLTKGQEGVWRRLLEEGDVALAHFRLGLAEEKYDAAEAAGATFEELGLRAEALSQKNGEFPYALEEWIVDGDCMNEADKKSDLVEGFRCEINKYSIPGSVDDEKLVQVYKKFITFLEDVAVDKADHTSRGRYYLELADSLERLGRDTEAYNLYEDVLVMDLDDGSAKTALNEAFEKKETSFSSIQFSRMVFEYQFIGRFDRSGLTTTDYKWTFEDQEEFDYSDLGAGRFVELVADVLQGNENNQKKGPVRNNIVASPDYGTQENPEDWNDLQFLELKQGFEFNYKIRDMAGNAVCGSEGGYVKGGSPEGTSYRNEEDVRLNFREERICESSIRNFVATVTFKEIMGEKVKSTPWRSKVVLNLGIVKGIYPPGPMKIVNSL